MTDNHQRASHSDIIMRLKRAQGHLAGVINVMEHGKPCLELAQQLHSVEKALQQAKRVLVQDHIDHCLVAAIGPRAPDQQSRIDEFKAIARYL